MPFRFTSNSLGRIDAFIGGRNTNISFDPHPPELCFAGRIDTVSVESVAALIRRAAGTQSITIGVK